MKPQFEILFLEEAFNFLKQLERKHYEKVLYNIRRAQNETNLIYLRNYLMIFGSLELCIKDYSIDYLLFGIKQQQQKQ